MCIKHENFLSLSGRGFKVRGVFVCRVYRTPVVFGNCVDVWLLLLPPAPVGAMRCVARKKDFNFALFVFTVPKINRQGTLRHRLFHHTVFFIPIVERRASAPVSSLFVLMFLFSFLSRSQSIFRKAPANHFQIPAKSIKAASGTVFYQPESLTS